MADADMAKVLRRMETQRAEFEALDALTKAAKVLPAVVDDDYPLMRSRYETALFNFLRAVVLNRG